MAVAAASSSTSSPKSRPIDAPLNALERVRPQTLPEDPHRDELRRRLAEERESLGPQGEHLFSDGRLQRFLEGNDGDVEEAVAHFRRMLQVRREARMEEEIRPLVEGKPFKSESLDGMQRFFDLMATTVGGYTPDGHMIMVFCDGKVRINEVMATPEDELFQCMLGMCDLREDHMDQRSYERSKLMKVFQIRDLSGLSIAKIARDAIVMQRVSKVTKTISTAYPETVHRVLVINVPRSFSILWRVMGPLFNSRTREKMLFAEDDFLPQLAMMAGSAGFEALARARRDVPAERYASFEVRSGAMACASQKLGPAEQASWSFEVGTETTTVSLLVIFCPDGQNPVLEYVTGPTDERGEVQGRYAAKSDGVLFFSWMNPSSWTGTSLYIDSWILCVGGHAEDMTRQAPVRRISSSSRTQDQRRGAPGCLPSCLNWARMRRRSVRESLAPERPSPRAMPESASLIVSAVENHSNDVVRESDGQQLHKSNMGVNGATVTAGISSNLRLLLVLMLMLFLLPSLALLAI